MSVLQLVTEARADLVRRRRQSSCPELYDLLDAVTDPEIPALSIWDLGVLQNVEEAVGLVRVTITPTYSGCPAMDVISRQAVECLQQAGYPDVEVILQLSPAWSTDWMDVHARRRLSAYGVAPPGDTSCPQCGSSETEVISDYGSTACKALHR